MYLAPVQQVPAAHPAEYLEYSSVRYISIASSLDNALTPTAVRRPVFFNCEEVEISPHCGGNQVEGALVEQ